MRLGSLGELSGDEQRFAEQLRKMNVPLILVEDTIRLQRLGLDKVEPSPDCTKPLTTEELEKWPNLNAERVEHGKSCLWCGVMIRCWPSLKSMKPKQ